MIGTKVLITVLLKQPLTYYGEVLKEVDIAGQACNLILKDLSNGDEWLLKKIVNKDNLNERST